MVCDHEKYMKRCLELARSAVGYTSPNPMVGSVVVYKGKIIGEGFHRRCGEAHAEVNAINSVINKDLLKQSTLYVNLEPWAHVGRTPSCARTIADIGVKKVVIGTGDPYEKVNGQGISILKNAGIEVITDILNEECRALNYRFFTFHEKKRPYIILKWAQSLDGFIDFVRSKNTPVQPNWITDDYARVLVHRWRAEEDAILVGTNTAEKDNPKLDTRDWFGKNPVRIVVDRTLRLDSQLNLFDNSVKTLIINSEIKKIEGNIEYIKLNFETGFVQSLLKELHQRRVLSVIVEGGAAIINDFIRNNIWDEARYFIGKKMFLDGIKAPRININPKNVVLPGNSTLYVLKNN
jgi:diaminohydroxyphosphoribosylaminopyrimidine deaminase/5-amino-6-(5-phosphoribosylamino)uracil reductase